MVPIEVVLEDSHGNWKYCKCSRRGTASSFWMLIDQEAIVVRRT
jgi:hypothetical protein